MLADTQATKNKVVTEILENPVYSPDSGICSRLHDVLMKLSKDDLNMLKLVLEMKQGGD